MKHAMHFEGLLFVCAVLVPLSSALREHSHGEPLAPKPQLPHPANMLATHIQRSLPGNNAAISPVKTAVEAEKTGAALRFPEENLPFPGINLQHKDSKKVLFPYEMRFFSSSIRIAIGE